MTYTPPDTGVPDYDPNLPVYSSPELRANDKPTEDYIDHNKATVEGRATNMLKTGSPILEAARSDSNLQYGRRGLLNTGQAVSAGTQAVIREAKDIASPDAVTYSKFGLQAQQGDVSQRLESLRGDISGALTTQEQKGNVETQKMMDTSQKQRVILDNQWKYQMNYDNLDAQTQQTLTAAAQGIGQEYQGAVERVLRDTNVENKTDAIEALQQVYRNNLVTAGAIAGIEVTWD